MERRYIENDPEAAPQYAVFRNSDVDAPYVFVPDDAKYTVPDGGRIKKQGAEGAGDASNTESSSSPGLLQTLRNKKRWIIVGGLILLAVIIAAAVAGGVVGSRHHSTSTSASSTSSGNSSSTQSSTGSSPTSFTAPSGGGNTTANSLVNKAWAYNGTNIATLTFSTTADTTGTNYLVFYQHSNGDIRQVVYNNSQWHNSDFVTNDARPGSPLSVYWKDNFALTLFYVDKSNVLQELRGNHGSNTWLNGTLGQLSTTTSDPGDISMVYFGNCAVGGTSGLLLYNPPSGNQMGLLYWDGATDTWSQAGMTSNVKPGAGLAAHADIGRWRAYYVEQSTSVLKEQICPDCCSNSTSSGWRPDLDGPVVNSQSGLSVTNVGLPRLIYYGDETGVIRELNNSFQYPTEAYISDAASQADGGNTGTPIFGNSTASMPSGVVVATGIPNGKISMAAGFRGKIQQQWLFYQAKGNDITMQIRDAGATGNWTEPTTIPVGIQ